MNHAILRLIIPSLWIAWLIYWWISARNVKPVAREESARSSFSHHALLVIGGLLLGLPRMPGGILAGRFIDRSLYQFSIAACLVALGLGFAVWARSYLSGNWSAAVAVKTGHEFIRTGPYSYVRHPIYTGMLTGLAGTALAVGEWRCLIGFALAFAGLWRKLSLEEAWLVETFGAQYADYRANVPALIPFLL